jgi:hypothetical protein
MLTVRGCVALWLWLEGCLVMVGSHDMIMSYSSCICMGVFVWCVAQHACHTMTESHRPIDCYFRLWFFVILMCQERGCAGLYSQYKHNAVTAVVTSPQQLNVVDSTEQQRRSAVIIVLLRDSPDHEAPCQSLVRVCVLPAQAPGATLVVCMFSSNLCSLVVPIYISLMVARYA